MTDGFTAFKKRDNPIKRAMIKWLDSQFEEQQAHLTQPGDLESITFRLSEFENGVREILDRSEMPVASIRAHSGNLSFQPAVSPDESVQVDEDEPLGRGPNRPITRADMFVSFSRSQLDDLIAARVRWDATRTLKSSPQISARQI